MTVEVSQHQFQIRRVVPQELKTSATRLHRCQTFRHHRQAGKLQLPFRQRLCQCGPFRAQRQSERAALDVASGINSSALAQQCRPHSESGIGRLGELPSLQRSLHELLVIHSTQYTQPKTQNQASWREKAGEKHHRLFPALSVGETPHRL